MLPRKNVLRNPWDQRLVLHLFKRCRGTISYMYLSNEGPTEIFDISCCEAAFSRDSTASSILWRSTVYRETRRTNGFYRVQEARRKPGIQAGREERGISLNRAIIDLRWYLVNTGGDVRSWPHTLGSHTATSPILLSSFLPPSPPAERLFPSFFATDISFAGTEPLLDL